MILLLQQDPTVAAARMLPRSLRARLPAEAAAFVEQEVRVQGTVVGHVADDFAAGRSRSSFKLHGDAAATQLEIHFADGLPAERDLHGMSGKRAVLDAMRVGDHLLILDRKKVQLEAAGGSGGTGTVVAAGSVVQGNQTTLSILVNFTDKAIACTAGDVQNRLFGSAGATVNNNYRESSRGLVSFSGRAVGPYTINYSSAGCLRLLRLGERGERGREGRRLRSGAVPARQLRDAGQLDLRLVGPGVHARQAVVGAGVRRDRRLQPRARAQPVPASRCHADRRVRRRLRSHGRRAYGRPQRRQPDDGRMDARRLGAGCRQRRLVRAGERVDERRRGLAAGAAHRQAGHREYYYVSFRQALNLDASLSSTYLNTMAVHRAAGTLPTRTYLLQNVAAGASFTDAVNGITLTNQGISNGTMTVGVGFSGGSCVRGAPVVTVSPSSQTAAPGAAVGYGITVTNKNTAYCGSSTFSMSQALPAGFSGAFAAPNLSIAAGSSASTTWSVSSSAQTAAGTYPFDATAADASFGNSATAHASQIVYRDSTLPTVSILSPANGAVVSGRVSIAASASDDTRVAAVEFYVDGVLVGRDTGGSFSAGWNSRKAGFGSHTIMVRALDAAGNKAEQSIVVQVK